MRRKFSRRISSRLQAFLPAHRPHRGWASGLLAPEQAFFLSASSRRAGEVGYSRMLAPVSVVDGHKSHLMHEEEMTRVQVPSGTFSTLEAVKLEWFAHGICLIDPLRSHSVKNPRLPLFLTPAPGVTLNTSLLNGPACFPHYFLCN